MFGYHISSYFFGNYLLHLFGDDFNINNDVFHYPYNLLGQMEVEILFPSNPIYKKAFILSFILFEKIYGQRPIYTYDSKTLYKTGKRIKLGFKISLNKFNFYNFLVVNNNYSYLKRNELYLLFFMNKKRNVLLNNKLLYNVNFNVNKDVRDYGLMLDSIQYKIIFNYPTFNNSEFNYFLFHSYGLNNIFQPSDDR